MNPGERKSIEMKNSFSTRTRGSNYPAIAGAGDQESPVLGGRSSWDQGANQHFNTYLVMRGREACVILHPLKVPFKRKYAHKI